MLLLGLGVLFWGESGLWKALVRTIFLDFGQKSGRSAEGMSFDEAGCLNRNSKRTAWRSRFRSARTLHPLNWSVKSVARKRARKWGKKCTVLRWRRQRAAMTFGACCEAKCSALPCRPLSSSNPNAVHSRFCSFLFSNKTSLSSLLFSPLRLVSGRKSPRRLSRFVLFCPARTHYTHMCVTTNYVRAAHKAAFRFLVFRKFVVSLPQLDFFVI